MALMSKVLAVLLLGAAAPGAQAVRTVGSGKVTAKALASCPEKVHLDAKGECVDESDKDAYGCCDDKCQQDIALAQWELEGRVASYSKGCSFGPNDIVPREDGEFELKDPSVLCSSQCQNFFASLTPVSDFTELRSRCAGQEGFDRIDSLLHLVSSIDALGHRCGPTPTTTTPAVPRTTTTTIAQKTCGSVGQDPYHPAFSFGGKCCSGLIYVKSKWWSDSVCSFRCFECSTDGENPYRECNSDCGDCKIPCCAGLAEMNVKGNIMCTRRKEQEAA